MEVQVVQSVIPVIHIEVLKKGQSQVPNAELREKIIKYITSLFVLAPPAQIIPNSAIQDDFLQEHIKRVMISQPDAATEVSPMYEVHVYTLDESGLQTEELDESEGVSSAGHWILPSAEFDGLWESLVFDDAIKSKLLNFVSTTLLFSDRGVDASLVNWNRVVLLHGPPGTGKTSLCKALAQKLAIRLSHRYKYGQLIEINSHSLFSKWFSESGKLVQKLFTQIQELVDDPNTLVCLLMDEVESLTRARQSALNGTEPSDALRVVNAVLTQIDLIKRFPNVLILTTSNVTEAIDLAFVDRADIKQYIGLPSPRAIYQIYVSCLEELLRVGIITSTETFVKESEIDASNLVSPSRALWTIAGKSEGLSGRTLRKLPFLAHALFLQAPSSDMGSFLIALTKAVNQQFVERKQLSL